MQHYNYLRSAALKLWDDLVAQGFHDGPEGLQPTWESRAIAQAADHLHSAFDILRNAPECYHRIVNAELAQGDIGAYNA